MEREISDIIIWGAALNQPPHKKILGISTNVRLYISEHPQQKHPINVYGPIWCEIYHRQQQTIVQTSNAHRGEKLPTDDNKFRWNEALTHFLH